MSAKASSITESIATTFKGVAETPYPEPDKLKAELEEMLKGFEPTGEVFYSYGYYYLRSPKFQRLRKINRPSSMFHGQIYDAVLAKYTTNIPALDTKTKEEILKIGAMEYKIHLMPKRNFLIPVLNILFEFLENNDLNKYIHAVKIAKNPGAVTTSNQVMPDIVIYAILGKENSTLVLEAISALFAQYNTDKIGSGITPRYSLKRDALVSYTQLGGDIKNALSPGDRRKYLTNSQTHVAPTIASQEPHLCVADIPNPVNPDVENAATQKYDGEENVERGHEKPDIKTKDEHEKVIVKKINDAISQAIQGVSGFLDIKIVEKSAKYPMHIWLKTSTLMLSTFTTKSLKVYLESHNITCLPRVDKEGFYCRIFVAEAVANIHDENFVANFVKGYRSQLASRPKLDPKLQAYKDAQLLAYNNFSKKASAVFHDKHTPVAAPKRHASEPLERVLLSDNAKERGPEPIPEAAASEASEASVVIKKRNSKRRKLN